jgi:hypothetical protein
MLNEQNKIIKENIDLDVYFLLDNENQLQQASKLIQNPSAKREWINKDPQQIFAYSCIPMTNASESGVWIVADSSFNVFWNGGKLLQDVIFTFDSEDDKKNSLVSVSSHFPTGIITFSLPFIFRTPPGWGLYVSGCPNFPINGLQALEAIVETNWLPFTFTMNYKITEPNKVVRIEKGMPICRIIPHQLNLNEKININLKKISDDKNLMNKWKEWSDSRFAWNSSLRDKSKNGDNKTPPYSNSLRQNFYRDGTDASGNGKEYKGMHKHSYKISNINDTKANCPFLNALKKYKIL